MLLPLSTSLSAMLTLTLLLITYGCFADDPTTFTPTNIKSFSDGKNAYRHLVFDTDAEYLYVGAMEHVYRLDALDIEQGFIKSQKLDPIPSDKSRCLTQGKTEEFECKNHIRSIILHPDKVVVCGTGAYKQRMYTLKKEGLELTDSGRSGGGRGFCPFDPNDNSTYIYIQKGNPGGLPALYSGTVTDSKADPMVLRPPLRKNNIEYSLLRTLIREKTWLHEAQFVGSFDMGDYVYFFFRESAVEYMNCGTAIYARVARVCKRDEGGMSVLEKRWTSFVKARLNCSLPGNYPYYFNELNDVYQQDGLFYGVFTTPRNGQFGSAVCAFTRAEIEAAFNGNFKQQLDTMYKWMKVKDSDVPTPRPGLCSNDSQNQPDNVLQFIKTHPLMDAAVRPKKGYPMFQQDNVLFRNIVVDTVNEYKVFFLGTDRGEIHKVVQWTDGNSHKSRTLAVWKPFGNTVNPVWQMKLNKKQLYLGSDLNVLQLPVEQCESYTLCTECIRDPYCGWDETWHTCAINRTGLQQGVKEDHPAEFCDNFCPAKSYSTKVRLQGDPVYLHCNSTCSATSSVQWYRGNRRLTIDYKKYFLTENQGLIIMNVTSVDGATYRCQSGTILRTEHILHITPCSDPACYFEEEFRNWCTAFDQYKEDFNHWRCLKDTCLEDDRCMPTNVAATCKKP
ncbi:hypothetical protein NP493_1055g00005 [Ridgeia piscesae]|uniref:Semaphorin-2A n=1 Tax=Ridgeia piscesae TaxID=27915 RepID=A0AAD9KHL2_RIDPI|nr:hypothetical protein NP493_1055g00005 [Ridgeia piscesae]